MYLQKIYEQTIYSQKSKYTRSDFDLDNVLVDANPYRVSFVEKGDLELFGSYELSRSNFSAEADKFNEQSLSLSIPKGQYVLLYAGGGILSKTTGKVNDCIKTTAAGNIKFDDFTLTTEEIASATDENIASIISSKGYKTLKHFTFKGNSRSKIRFWVSDENANNLVGAVTLAIFKISDDKIIPRESSACFIGAEGDFTANLNTSKVYSLTVSKLLKGDPSQPTTKIIKKYPVGTYQITVNDTVASSQSSEDLVTAIEVDKQRFSISSETGKLTNLNNIEIPKDVDPANYYFMIGKVQLMLYIDFNNDDYYIYPASYAECFMNLFLPKMEVEEVEMTNDYAVYSIIDFTIISYDYKNPTTIKTNIRRWINCDERDIHVDEYDLYYWVDTFNLYDWYFMKYKSIIEANFMTIHLYDIKATIFDDVNEAFVNPDHILEYSIDECRWRIEDNPENKYGFINWNYDAQWQNTDVPNKIKLICNGSAYVKVSKKHFYNIVTENNAHSGDFIHNPDGNLTDSQFRKLNLNGPEINPYQRFQYWLGVKL